MKKCLKEEKPKTQNENRRERREEKREEPKLEPWCCYIVLSPKAYKSVLSPSP